MRWPWLDSKYYHVIYWLKSLEMQYLTPCCVPYFACSMLSDSCFGGSGAVLYSFFSGADMKVAVALHGSFTDLPPVLVDQISPYLLM